MFTPSVSILINNYNYGRFLGEAIRSARCQTYDRIEIIVVDDGSSDNSREIIEEFGDELVAVFKSNEGQASAFNTGFAKSSGDIICFLDADDIFLPTKVQRIVETYADPAMGWCFHPLQWVDINREHMVGSRDIRYPSRSYDFRKVYLRGKPVLWAPPTSGLTFRRSLLDKLLPMPQQIRITADNYLTFSTPAFAPGFYISECLSQQRIHGVNAYTAKEDSRFKATVQISIASGLHDSFPQLSRLANRLFANAIAAKWTAGSESRTVRQELNQYIGKCTVLERFEVLTRMAYRMLRPRVQRASAPCTVRSKPLSIH
ncbi:MAG: glycosyltransferase family 2 protein [Terriglobales bacterium]